MHENGARMHQVVYLVIVLVFILNLVKSQSLNHNLSSKERNELK
jgi:hypothetical protein